MKRTDRLTSVLGLVLFLAFLAYVGANAARRVTDRISTVQAVAASVAEDCATNGIIVRQERVLESGEPYIDVIMGEGEKVSAWETVAVGVRSESAISALGNIRSLEADIQRLSSLLEGLGPGTDLTVRDRSLRQAVEQLTGAVARQEYGKLDAGTMKLRSLVFTGGTASTELELDRMQQELARLRNNVERDAVEIKAPASGYFSAVLDGWEHLSPEDLEGLTPEGLGNLINSAGSPPANGVGKLVNDFNWYYAAVLPRAGAARLAAGDMVTLDFSLHSGETVRAEVVSLSEEADDSVAAVFRCDTAMAETIALRRVAATLVFGQYNGLRLPTEAIREDEEGTYVWTVTAMQLERKAVELLYANDSFCLVRRENGTGSLREGNTVVVDGENLYEGKIMK